MPPKYLTLIRHAEGYHNLTGNHSLLDPCLTPTGIQQCNILNNTFLQSSHPSSPPPPPQPSLLVSSPLTRTLQTTLCSFSTFLSTPPNTDMKITPLALLQECDDIPCDTGRPAEVTQKEFSGNGDLTALELGNLTGDHGAGEGRIQWEVLDPVFPRKVGIYRAEKEALVERAKQARKWLWEREEEHVVAVLHGGFLHYMTEDWSGHNPKIGTGWYNTEYRTYEFLSAGNEAHPMYSIQEIEWSNKRREAEGQKNKPLSKTEMKEFQETVIDGAVEVPLN
ncbi:histidine phosphatase superfamily [Terfezia claveryi]|nr:histidine phosphatase superfamily [Terfezia claveryi]